MMAWTPTSMMNSGVKNFHHFIMETPAMPQAMGSDGCRPHDVGKAVTKLETEDGKLAAHTEQVCQGGHDWHGNNGLAGSGGDEGN